MRTRTSISIVAATGWLVAACSAPSMPPAEGGPAGVGPDGAPIEGGEASPGGEAGPGEPGEPELHGPEPGMEDDAGADAAAASPPPEVELDKPTLTTGEIKDLDKRLDANKEAIATCVADNGGLEADKGSIKIQFLVQGAGKAEGVDILKREAVSEAAGKCIKDHLNKRDIGTPSEEPIGVTVVIRLTAKK